MRPVIRLTCVVASLFALAMTLQRLGIAGAGLEPSAQWPPEARQCTVQGSQHAEPSIAELYRPVTLSLSVSATCPVEAPGRADILLALDHSGSMRQDGKAVAAHGAVRQFTSWVDFAHDRLGLLVFNETAYIVQPLTGRRERVLSALDELPIPSGGTYVAQAIGLAAREFAYAGRPDAAQVLVLLTDGLDDPSAMQAAARAVHRQGIVVMVIALGSDAAGAALRSVASSERFVYFAPTSEELVGIYRTIANLILTFVVTEVRIVDRLSADVTYVVGSGLPEEPQGDRELAWQRSTLSGQTTVIRYAVRPERVGRLQPSAMVWVDYTDGDGVRRRLAIEPATILVSEPVRHSVFLPVVQRQHCVAAVQHADVVLVIDASDSMKGEKLARAIDAARIFIELLDLPRDQAAVVSYDASPIVRVSLTGDRQALLVALADLVPGSGTRIDRAMLAAIQVLSGVGRIAENRPVVVLLSDGIQVEERPQAFAAGERARSAGIEVFTIALGADADHPLLAAIATDPSHAYRAPKTTELEEIYRRIAGQVVCR